MKKSYSNIGSIGFVFMLTTFVCGSAKAQTQLIKGRITGNGVTSANVDNGKVSVQGISGVVVAQEGSGQTTVSSPSGAYQINVFGENPILIFRHPDFGEQRIAVNRREVMNVVLSRINYSGDTIIELVPDLNLSEINREIYLIKDSSYYSIDKEKYNQIDLSEIFKTQIGRNLKQKKDGALFINEWIPNYHNRKNLNDTMLFNKKYKRFEINSPWSYSRFYIYRTDTILPYSMYRHAEKDYKGRLERMDTYNKKENIFVTLQILPRKTWDIEANEVFKYNRFLSSKK